MAAHRIRGMCRMRKSGRKAQVAMEYLHTYGWIFLSVLMLAGVMVYYNTSRAQYILPLDCSFLSGVSCLDADAEEDLLSVVIVNGLGFSVSNVTIEVIGTCNSTANTTDGNMYGNQNVLLQNQQATYVFECQNLTNIKLTERVNMTYQNVDVGQTHVKMGKIEYSPTA